MGVVATKGFKFRGVPKELINLFIQENKYERFLETGTYQGETAFWAKNNFPEVFTIEANEEFFNTYPKDAGINFVLGDSGELLQNYISNNIVIYLDAHYSGGATYNSYPLMQELSLINKFNPKNVLIIIDDARFCMTKWNDEKYGNLSDIIELLSFGKTRHVVSFDDMIIACDVENSDLLDNYTNTESKKYWSVFLEENIKIPRKKKKKFTKRLFVYLKRLFKLR
jgi:hypothetical protein